MHVSEKGINLITEFEGFSAKAYKDPGSKDGLPITIGYGTTQINGKPVKMGDTITKARAKTLLKEHLVSYEDGVLAALAGSELNQNQFDALVSLVYNIGIKAFKNSTVKRRIAAGDMLAGANAFGMWIKNDGKVMAGLVRRRAAEKALFLTPVEAVQGPKAVEPPLPTATTPTTTEKPLIQSKEIGAGLGMTVGGVVTAVQSISVDDLVSAQASVKQTRTEVAADKTIMFHNYIIQGASILFFLIGVFIIYKRIKARMDGHR